MALVALDEAGGTDEGLHVRAGVAALGARKRRGLLAPTTPVASCAGAATAGS